MPRHPAGTLSARFGPAGRRAGAGPSGLIMMPCIPNPRPRPPPLAPKPGTEKVGDKAACVDAAAMAGSGMLCAGSNGADGRDASLRAPDGAAIGKSAVRARLAGGGSSGASGLVNMAKYDAHMSAFGPLSAWACDSFTDPSDSNGVTCVGVAAAKLPKLLANLMPPPYGCFTMNILPPMAICPWQASANSVAASSCGNSTCTVFGLMNRINSWTLKLLSMAICLHAESTASSPSCARAVPCTTMVLGVVIPGWKRTRT
mmetsp:Transcript_17589/g.40681  ORF Transcript_17589/g.40681 Transcript_17589/m.40681 type:complete len:258 (-) Transcript_17589:329-1102(-)